MKEYQEVQHVQESKSVSANSDSKANQSAIQLGHPMQLMANSSQRIVQLRSMQQLADQKTVQRQVNNTGLPDNLKSGIENLSGYSMNDVKVHYNSDKPAQLNAHAYAQGNQIHLASGQEKHLPHEAWHVVQQKQGRVQPTKQLKGKVGINDDEGLEREADMMGEKALQLMGNAIPSSSVDEFQKNEFPVRNTRNSFRQTFAVQRIMKKLGLEKDAYRKKTMSTVYLFATFDGKDLGIFHTEKVGHAEEMLVAKIKELGLKDGKLVIYLSTSPCSSTFGTRDDGHLGCHEHLESLSERGITVDVRADHLYQPQMIGAMERESGFPTGFSSFSAAASSSFDISFSHLPKSFQDSDMVDDSEGPVAQLKSIQPLADHAVIQRQKWSTGALDGKQSDVDWWTQTLGGEQVGIEMKATILGPDHPQGTPPKSGVQKKLMDKLPTDPSLANENKYIRGHLLNDNLGGMGEAYNMFPITANANKAHEKVIESKVKDWVNNDKQWVYYHVKVNNIDDKLSTKGYVDAVLDCEASVLDDSNNKISTIKAQIVSDYTKVRITDEKNAIDNKQREAIGDDAMGHKVLLSTSKKIKEKLDEDTWMHLCFLFNDKDSALLLKTKMLEYEGIGKTTVKNLSEMTDSDVDMVDVKVESAIQKVLRKIGGNELWDIISDVYDVYF